MTTALPANEVAARLCAACGMCCNGVMFHGIRLQPSDSARELALLGLKAKRRQAGLIVLQPCVAHRGNCCAIYEGRPTRCREFVCRQLIAVARCEASEEEASAKIFEAHALTDRVLRLIREAGDDREHKSLATRCDSVLAPPFDQASEAARRREDLRAAMVKLEAFLVRDFRVEEPVPSV